MIADFQLNASRAYFKLTIIPQVLVMYLGLYIYNLRGRQHSFVEIDHEIFSTVILSLPLIQEGQLSVSGERICTILVNCFDDKACPVNVWLGKLTALDMTLLG